MGEPNLRLIKGQREDGAVQATDPDAPRQRRKLPKWSRWLLASAAISSATMITLCSTKLVDLTPEPPKPMPPKEEACNPAVLHSSRHLKMNIGSRLRSNAGSVRSALGAEDLPIRVFVSLYVDTNGTAKIHGSSAVCDGEKCQKDAQPHRAAGISSTGLPPVTAPNERCRFSFAVAIPADGIRM